MEQREFVALLDGSDFEKLRAEVQRHPRWVQREILEEYCPKALGRGRAGNRPFALACYFGNPRVIDLLLAAGADPSHRNDEKRSGYHVALEHNIGAAKHLAQIGLERDHIACTCLRDLEGLRRLLEADASLANDHSTGLSTLGWATYYGALESAKLLIEYGARPVHGELHCAAGIANAEMGKFLLENGADIEERASETDWTPLHVAVIHLYTNDAAPFVEMLLNRGADRRAHAGSRMVTPLDLARIGLKRQMDAQIARNDPQWKNFSGVIALLERQ